MYGLPRLFEAGEKIAIDALDLETGTQIRLAVLNEGQNSQLQTKRWTFDPNIIEWGNNVLESTAPCDLLIIDELGPLEFVREQGWVNGIQAVSKGEYKVALVVVRPSLLEVAQKLWPDSVVIDLSKESQDPLELYESLGLD